MEGKSRHGAPLARIPHMNEEELSIKGKKPAL